MTYQEIQNQIVSAFWSRTLRDWIAQNHYVFPPEKLLSIAYKSTYSDTERLKRMRLFAEEVPEAAEHARRVIQWKEDCLAAFREADENTVFEIRIDSDGTDDSIRYLCSTFTQCLDAIGQYYESHTWDKETENACHTIVKRRILRPGDHIDLYEDQYTDLGPGGVITGIPTGGTCEYGDCEGYCPDCPNPCVENWQELIPPFIPDLSPVRYLDFAKKVRFGCVLSDGGDSWECYLIPLDSSMFADGLEEHRDFLDHEHIPWTNVEQITPGELPEELRSNYCAFVSFWKSQYPETYKENEP